MSNVSSSNGLDKRVPKLRFPEFSGDWHNYNMGQIYTERKESGNDKLPILTVSIHTGVSDGALDETELGKRVKRSEDKSTYKIARKNDLVFNMMRAWQGAIGTVRTTGMVSPAYIVAYPNDLVEPIFMDYLVKCKQMIDSIHRLSYGVTDFRLRLYWDSFVEIPINVPSLEEQNKIASFLTLLDKRIAKQRELVENLKSYKRGVINGLFSRKLAFAKEGCFDWNYIKISDMFEPVIDKNHPDDTVLTIIQGLGTVPRNSMDRHISYNKESVNSYKRVKKGDFILHLRSFEGGLEVANEQGIVSPAYTILRSKGNIATKFYYAYFRSFEFIENKLRISVEGIRDGKSINMQTFWNIPIPVPKIDEQYKIASFLEKIDKKITYEINLLDKIEKQKSALLSEMFI